MRNEVEGTISNILKANNCESKALTNILSKCFDFYFKKSIIKTVENFKNDINIEFDEIINLTNYIIANSGFLFNKNSEYNLKSKILYSGDVNPKVINYKDFQNLESANYWLKMLINDRIFENIDENLRDDVSDEHLEVLTEHYQQDEILPFKIPVEYYKLLVNSDNFSQIKITNFVLYFYSKFPENKYLENELICNMLSNKICIYDTFDKKESSIESEFEKRISFPHLEINIECDQPTFSRKVQEERNRCSKVITYKNELKYNNVLELSCSVNQLNFNGNSNLSTLQNLYFVFFSSSCVVNKDEISLCINSLDNCNSNQGHFNEFLRDNLDTLVIVNKFLLLKILRIGNFGHIYVAIDILLRKLCCIKKIKNLNKEDFNSGIIEANTVKMLNKSPISKFVPEYVDFVLIREDLFLITELLGDDLLTLINKFKNKADKFFSLGKIQRIIHQLLTCVEYLHEKCELIHCDIKPENIVIDSIDSFDLVGYLNQEVNLDAYMNIKLIDWGSCTSIFQALTKKNSYLQSRYYRSPEVCLGLSYNEKIDIWSIGCVMAELFLERPLFGYSKTTQQLLANIVSIIGKIPIHMIQESTTIDHFLTPDGHLFEEHMGGKIRIYTVFSESFAKKESLEDIINAENDPLFLDLLKSLLCIDPKRRLSASQALNHPWFNFHYTDGL